MSASNQHSDLFAAVHNGLTEHANEYGVDPEAMAALRSLEEALEVETGAARIALAEAARQIRSLEEQLEAAQEEIRHWKYDHQEASKELVVRAKRAEEQYQTALRAVDAARVILTLADEERDELAGEVSKYLGPWADLVEAVHAVSYPASSLRPTVPLFESGDPNNSEKAEAHFGGSDPASAPRPKFPLFSSGRSDVSNQDRSRSDVD